MSTTRRDLFKLIGGSVAGALFTPAPWRLITDTALWSENWPGIPRPRQGEITTKLTYCMLCPAGCAVRARCVGGQPVSLAGVRGGLCPFGVAGHHLPYHPARASSGSIGQAKDRIAAAIARCGRNESVAILDLHPGRTASWTYRRAMASLPNGVYIAAPRPSVAVNLSAARTVVSLGAPLLDGWIAPSRAFAARDRFRLIQVEAIESRTAALADRWIPARPGSGETIDEGLERELRQNGPALVIDPAMSPNVVALNGALGAWGNTIGPRADAPVPAAWKTAAPVKFPAGIPDRSIGVLLIDAPAPGVSIPWNQIQPKLAADAIVATFGFSNSFPYPRQLAIPCAVYPEAADDAPAPVDSPEPLFRLATPLAAAPSGLPSAAEFVADLAGLPKGDALSERARAIHATGRGSLISLDGAATPIRKIGPDELWKRLNAGDFWRGDPPPPGRAPRIQMQPAPPAEDGLIVAVAGTAIDSSPLLSKIYRESNLRLAPGRIALNPCCGIPDDARALLRTDLGDRRVMVTLDAGVSPGVVLTAASELAGAHAKVVLL